LAGKTREQAAVNKRQIKPHTIVNQNPTDLDKQVNIQTCTHLEFDRGKDIYDKATPAGKRAHVQAATQSKRMINW